MPRCLVLLLVCSMLLPCAREVRAGEPLPFIFDTDLGNDIDDALALAVVHELADRGEIQLLAVTVAKDHPMSAPYIDLVNRFYHRPVPIGQTRSGVKPQKSRYTRPLVELTENGMPVYPRQLASGRDAPEAVDLLRRILAAQADSSVVLVSVGNLTNIAGLLKSRPDAHAPLDGVSLVRRKILRYCLMGCTADVPRSKSNNVFTDLPAARVVLERWPGTLVASGKELGLKITYPAKSIEHDFNYVRHHPIAEAYRLWGAMPYDRPAWDLTAVLYAVRPDHGYLNVSYPGTFSVTPDSLTLFREHPDGRHRYLTASPEQVIRVREALVEMVSSPPRQTVTNGQ